MAMKERQHGQRAFWVLAVVYSVICIAAGVFVGILAGLVYAKVQKHL